MIQRNMDVEKVPKSIVNGVLPNQVLPSSQFVYPVSKIKLFKRK